jgi:hypothetical protein
MKKLPETPELIRVAERVVWFKSPESALDDPIHFPAHVMTYGTMEDLAALSDTVGPDELKEVLNHAPPGVFAPRLWASGPPGNK